MRLTISNGVSTVNPCTGSGIQSIYVNIEAAIAHAIGDNIGRACVSFTLTSRIGVSQKIEIKRKVFITVVVFGFVEDTGIALLSNSAAKAGTARRENSITAERHMVKSFFTFISNVLSLLNFVFSGGHR